MRVRDAAALLAATAISAGVLVGPHAAGAVSPPTPNPGTARPAQAAGFDFTAEPYNAPGSLPRGSFDYNVAPGQTVNDKIKVVNATTAPKDFFLYGADAYSAHQGGGFSLSNRPDKPVDAGAWITMPVAQYTVLARTTSVIPVRFTVPTDATPGDHIAGVVAEEVVKKPTDLQQPGTGFTTVHRVAARVYLRVAGPIHGSLEVKTLRVRHNDPQIPYLFGNQTAIVEYAITNTGNSRVRIDSVVAKLAGLVGGSFTSVSLIRPPAGSSVTNPLPDELLPRSEVRFTARFPSFTPLHPRVGVTVRVTGTDPVTSAPVAVSRTASYWAIPWLLVGLVVLVLALGLLVRRWRLRPRKPVENSASGLADATGPDVGADLQTTTIRA